MLQAHTPAGSLREICACVRDGYSGALAAYLVFLQLVLFMSALVQSGRHLSGCMFPHHHVYGAGSPVQCMHALKHIRQCRVG